MSIISNTASATAEHAAATDGGELTHSYSIESNNGVKIAKQAIIEMIHCEGFEAVERDTVYNRVDKVAA
ncbi:MAG: hypothetical protein IT174_06810 [Acidobacteria bacterium]|nr:hypothetical protein [Acidobacteriota bacterium]